MTRALRNEAREMVGELGPATAAAPDSLVRLHAEVMAIWKAKWALHEVLQGEQEDVDLLHKARQLIREFEGRVMKPLKQHVDSERREIARIRKLGRLAAKIVLKATPHHKAAEKRFREALSIGEEPCQNEGVVVALDMARYSEFALDLEQFLNSRVLFEFNKDIQAQFKKAIRDVGGDPNDTHIVNTGDGALVFLPNPDLAVRFAFAVQKDAFQRNLNIRPRAQRRRWRFRIGISTGKYCIQSYRDVGGRLLGFEAAGVTIINAVRIQTKCSAACILICDDAYKQLEKGLQRRFVRRFSIKAKRHERRSIVVWEWKYRRWHRGC
jgi:class 3 adenylate cyclase